MNWKILALSSLVTLPIIAVLAFSFGRDPHAVPFMMTGKEAPTFEIRHIGGGAAETVARLSKSDLAGQPFIMNFWATWCVPCQLEHPVFEWADKEIGQRIKIFGVLYEDDEATAREFLKAHPSRIAHYFDARGRMGVDYGLSGVPETYFVDRYGRIQYKHEGPIDAQTLVTKAAQLLTAPAP